MGKPDDPAPCTCAADVPRYTLSEIELAFVQIAADVFVPQPGHQRDYDARATTRRMTWHGFKDSLKRLRGQS